MMRKYMPAVIILLASVLDTMLFGWFDIFGIRPEALLAVITAYAVLKSTAPAAAFGIALGILADILFNGMIGPSAIALLFAALAGGAFYNKYYGDNPIAPGITAALVFFVKEHVMLLLSILMGRNLSSYFMLLLTHILPSMLLTGGLSALFFIILKAIMFRQPWRDDNLNE